MKWTNGHLRKYQKYGAQKMNVILSKDVEDGMIDYFNSLSGYGISEERAQEKYLEMKHKVCSDFALPS